MDFSVSDKIKTIVELIDEFVEKELYPLEPDFLSKDFRELLDAHDIPYSVVFDGYA